MLAPTVRLLKLNAYQDFLEARGVTSLPSVPCCVLSFFRREADYTVLTWGGWIL